MNHDSNHGKMLGSYFKYQSLLIQTWKLMKFQIENHIFTIFKTILQLF